MNTSLVILYEDPHCLAVVKPPGQFTQGSWAPENEITLETAVRLHIDPSAPDSVYVGIAHRLDRPTSGVLFWAKTPKAARRLSSQFERRRVSKEYWAIVELGDPNNRFASGEENWIDWLTRADARGIVSMAKPHAPGARQAITTVRLETTATSDLPPHSAWLRLWPETGRTHQLRAQTASRGMPILGDAAYGATISTTLAPGIALHARRLSLNHPITGVTMTLVAPLPSAWREAGIALTEE